MIGFFFPLTIISSTYDIERASRIWLRASKKILPKAADESTVGVHSLRRPITTIRLAAMAANFMILVLGTNGNDLRGGRSSSARVRSVAALRAGGGPVGNRLSRYRLDCLLENIVGRFVFRLVWRLLVHLHLIRGRTATFAH